MFNIQKIAYRRGHFGIYDIMSLLIIENVYAYVYSKETNLNISQSFLKKNGRGPTDLDLEFQNQLENGLICNLYCTYWFNWSNYASQNIRIKYPGLIPSTTEIMSICDDLFGHKIKNEIIFRIVKLMRHRMCDLSMHFNGVNVWQWMIIKHSLSLINQVNDDSICTLFNKIYRRKPLETEIEIIKKINLEERPEDIENEIKKHVELAFEKVVNIRSKFRRY